MGKISSEYNYCLRMSVFTERIKLIDSSQVPQQIDLFFIVLK